MSLATIGAYASTAATQLSALSSSSSASRSTVASTTSTQQSGASLFASAVSDAFAKLGLSFDASTGTVSSTTGATASTSTDGTDASSDASDAVTAFMQSLFAALHSQSAGNGPPAPDAAGDGPPPPPPVDATGSSTNVVEAHRHGGKLEADLQSLISELDSSTTLDSSSATDSATSSAGTTATTDTTLATLEKTFDALLAKTGRSTTGSDSLQSFLQTLATGLDGAPATGVVVSTAA